MQSTRSGIGGHMPAPTWMSATREGSMSTEVELKLSARPADLPELKRALLAMSPGSVATREQLTSTYYDTQTPALHERGLSLRVRGRAGRFTQTVKAADAADRSSDRRGRGTPDGRQRSRADKRDRA